MIACYSAYRIAGLFLPMTVMMILAALLAGRWTTVAGACGLLVARWALLFAAGLLLTNVVISPNPAYLPLAAALGLARDGIGTCVVPVTSSVLGAVPAELVGDGRVGHEHQPGVRRGHWHRHPGCCRQCRVAGWGSSAV